MWVSGMTLGYVRHKEFSMKKSKLWLGALAATLVFAMTAAGCDDGGGGLETLPGDVTISPSADVSTGTDSNTYVVQTADIGGTITVTVSRAGYTGSVTSAPTPVITAPVPSTLGLAFTLISNNTAYSVARGTASAAEVVIPATYEGKPVTAIAEEGFQSYRAMTSVTIIDSSAFYDCRGLVSVTIGNGVTYIGNYAFNDCRGLASVTIPDIRKTARFT